MRNWLWKFGGSLFFRQVSVGLNMSFFRLSFGRLSVRSGDWRSQGHCSRGGAVLEMFRFNRLVLDDCHDMVRQGPPHFRSADPSGNFRQWKKMTRFEEIQENHLWIMIHYVHWFSKLCNDVWYRAGTPKDPVVYHQFPRFSPLRLTWPGTWNSFSLPVLPSRICRTTWPRCPGVYFWTIPARNKWVITLVMNQVSRVSLQQKTRMNWATYDSWGVRSKLGLFMAGLTVPSWPRRGGLKVRSMLHLLPKGVASLRSSCHHSQLAVVPFRFGVTWSRNCWPIPQLDDKL